MWKTYSIILGQQASEALEREAGNRDFPPEALIETVLRNWLVAKGNLRIY